MSERVVYRELFLNGLTVLDLPMINRSAPLSATQQSAMAEVTEMLDALNVAPHRNGTLAQG